MIRLLLVIPNLDIGGAEKMMMFIADHLDPRQYNICFAVLNKIGIFSNYTNDTIRIINLKCRHVRSAFFKLRRVIRLFKPHIIFSSLTHLNILLLTMRIFTGIRSAYIVRESSIPSYQNKIERLGILYNLFCGRLYRSCNRIVCQSTDMADDLTGNFNIGRKTLRIIHNPIDNEKITILLKEKIDLPFCKAGYLLAVGRLSKEKGFDLLIEAFSLLHGDIKLIILGDGREKNNLTEHIKKRGMENKILLFGKVNNPYPYMRHAKLLLMSSHHEGFPNVLIEALCCGTPVIAYNCPGGTKEIIIEGRNGFLVDRWGAFFFKEGIERGLAYPFDRHEIINDTISRFRAKKIISQYDELFKETIS